MTYTPYWKQMFEEAEQSEEGQAQDTQSQETHDQGTDTRQQPKYTDADVDRIIDKKFKKWAEQQEKAVKEAEKLAKMSEQERLQHEKDELQKELQELKTEKARRSMADTVRKMLREQGIDADEELVEGLIREDAEKTAAAVKAFSQAFSSAVQAKISRKEPTVGTKTRLTKEQIKSEKDTRKRRQMISQNMDLFKNKK